MNNKKDRSYEDEDDDGAIDDEDNNDEGDSSSIENNPRSDSNTDDNQGINELELVVTSVSH